MRPSDAYKPALRTLGASLVAIAQVANGAGELDRAALAYAIASYRGLIDWRADLTETSRRHAAENAMACQALALAPVPGAGSLARQALAGYAAALRQFADANAPHAMATARAARATLYA